jgi:hypothetical protein
VVLAAVGPGVNCQNGGVSATVGGQTAYICNGSPDTAAQVLAKLLTVGGAGSGLDADKLDGLDSTQFVRTTAAQLCISGDCRTSWNNQDASSVAPMPRSCPVGQAAISTGSFKWTCGVLCAFGTADCDGNPNNGCEINVASDKNNCGACGTVCSAANMASVSCSGGSCNGACQAGFADCNGNKASDGCESNISSDHNNCGACGNVCSSNNIASLCVGAACSGACNAGFADCNFNKASDGCEASLSVSGNCGACGVTCTAGKLCKPLGATWSCQ